MQLFGLADCNNFYCSCERVFHPELNNRPVVVLSNNDGCVIARSNESKALGVKMGAPFYQVRQLLDDNHVAVFSSNYTLYGSLSHRVMSLLSQYTPHLDIYSIDEAFLDFSDMEKGCDLKAYGEQLVRRVSKSTGIPISLGIAPTRTLAKMASKFAKKYKGYHGCCLMDTDEKRQKALALFPIEDVWGIGRRISKQLEYFGIHTAAEFAAKSERWVRQHFNVTTARTWKELNGVSCISVDELPQKQSICTSRSFSGQGISDRHVLEEAVANFASRCAEKLRHQGSCCKSIMVFAYTSRFNERVPAHMIYETITLSVATQSSAEIIHETLKVLRRAYVPGTYYYKKAGVILMDIVPERPCQQDLFDKVDRRKQQLLTRTIDRINLLNGQNKVRLAIQGTDIRFGLKHEYLSHRYTTNIQDLLVVKV